VHAQTFFRGVSAVWDYFEKSEIEGKSKCLLCKEVVKHLSNTSNLAKVIFILDLHFSRELLTYLLLHIFFDLLFYF
jgi:hypothetical protein